MYGAFPTNPKKVNWRGLASVLVGAICVWGGAQLGLEETVTGPVCGALCALVAGAKPLKDAPPKEPPAE